MKWSFAENMCISIFIIYGQIIFLVCCIVCTALLLSVKTYQTSYTIVSNYMLMHAVYAVLLMIIGLLQLSHIFLLDGK